MITYKGGTEYSWEAYDGKKQIGEIILTDEHPELGGRRILQNISVNASHQKRGIATELLKNALAEYPDLLFDNKPRLTAASDESDEEGTFLTTDGMAFMRKCFSKGIISNDNLIKKISMPQPAKEKSAVATGTTTAASSATKPSVAAAMAASSTILKSHVTAASPESDFDPADFVDFSDLPDEPTEKKSPG